MGRFAWFAYGFLFCRTYKNLSRLTEHRPMLRKSAGNALPHRVRRCVLFIILRGGQKSTAIRAFGSKQSDLDFRTWTFGLGLSDLDFRTWTFGLGLSDLDFWARTFRTWTFGLGLWTWTF